MAWSGRAALPSNIAFSLLVLSYCCRSADLLCCMHSARDLAAQVQSNMYEYLQTGWVPLMIAVMSV